MEKDIEVNSEAKWDMNKDVAMGIEGDETFSKKIVDMNSIEIIKPMSKFFSL